MKGEEVWEDKPEIEKEAEVSKRIIGGSRHHVDPTWAPSRVQGKEGRTAGSRTCSSSLGYTPQGSHDDHRYLPSSRPPPGPRCNSSYTPGGPQSHPVGRDRTQRCHCNGASASHFMGQKGTEDDWQATGLTWQESWPSLPAHSMSSLMIRPM